MTYDENKKITAVLREFGVEFDSFHVETFHSGHINSTHKVEVRHKGKTDSFVLQRINTYVFPNPVKIMENIDQVTNHIRQKMIDRGENPRGRVLEFLSREDGTNYYFEDEERFWRVYRFIPNSITYDQSGDPDLLKSIGRAFGTFQKNLCEFPVDRLNDTLPDFHNTPKRMKNFFAACERDEKGRRSSIEKEIAILRENEPLWSQLEKFRQEGRIAARVTHNDTKCNNVLVDRDSGEAVCVIDLDTVTIGLCAYDFGDAVRFSANRAAEDEPDLEKVGLDLELYEAYAEGFISVCRDFCDEAELESLALGPVTLTFELAARFLEDYLNGDRYFKIRHPEHNLERGRSQLALALDMKKKMKEMQEINRRIVKA